MRHQTPGPNTYPGYGYPAYAPVTEVEECRVIVKRRYDEFGDLVVKRIRICD